MFISIRLNVPDEIADAVEVHAAQINQDLLALYGIKTDSETAYGQAQELAKLMTVYQTTTATAYAEVIQTLADESEGDQNLIQIACDGILADVVENAAS